MEAEITHQEMQEGNNDNDHVTQIFSFIWLFKYGDLWTINAVYGKQKPRTERKTWQSRKKEAMKPMDSNPGKNCEGIKGYNNTKEH